MGRWENLFAAEAPSAVVLSGDEDILDKMTYVLADPVAARLVKRGRDWPGLRSSGRQWTQAPFAVKRPPVFFRAD